MNHYYSEQFAKLAHKCYNDLWDLLALNGDKVVFNNDRNEIKVAVYNQFLDCVNIIEVSSIYIDRTDEEIRFTSTEPTVDGEYYLFDDICGLELWGFLYEMTLEQLND